MWPTTVNRIFELFRFIHSHKVKNIHLNKLINIHFRIVCLKNIQVAVIQLWDELVLNEQTLAREKKRRNSVNERKEIREKGYGPVIFSLTLR